MNPAPRQHTPGPWRYSEKHRAIVADCYPDWSDPSDPDQETVTKVCTLMGALGGHNPDADRAVMVAAPDLLAALQTIADQCGDFATVQPALDYATIGNIARAAIAKAKGQPAA